MGKRSAPAFAGLSHFVKQAFGEQPAQPPYRDAPVDPVPPPADFGQLPDEPELPVAFTSRKRQKTGLKKVTEPTEIPLDPKYNASGLVPHYRSALEVPEDLQKCS
jgi:hypothetical protein